MSRVKPKLKATKKHRIPYEAWIHSQLSIARHFGGCNLNGKEYRLDYGNCPKKIIDGEERWFPDLVQI